MSIYDYASLSLALNGIDTAIENIAHFMKYSRRTPEGERAITELRGTRIYVKDQLAEAIERRKAEEVKG